MEKKSIEFHIEAILKLLGDNPKRPGLNKTPERVTKALYQWTGGLRETLDDLFQEDALFPFLPEEIILVKDIEFYSLCEHHLLPFLGVCHIAYIPNGKIIGLSKIPKLLHFFAHRFQTQETLTYEIADVLMRRLNAKAVAVIIEAKHLCILMRGLKQKKSLVKTSVMLGLFNTDPSKSELFNLLK